MFVLSIFCPCTPATRFEAPGVAYRFRSNHQPCRTPDYRVSRVDAIMPLKNKTPVSSYEDRNGRPGTWGGVLAPFGKRTRAQSSDRASTVCKLAVHYYFVKLYHSSGGRLVKAKNTSHAPINAAKTRITSR